MLVLGPLLAILSTPRPLWVRLGLKWSGNVEPNADSPPLPVPGIINWDN